MRAILVLVSSTTMLQEKEAEEPRTEVLGEKTSVINFKKRKARLIARTLKDSFGSALPTDRKMRYILFSG